MLNEKRYKSHISKDFFDDIEVRRIRYYQSEIYLKNNCRKAVFITGILKTNSISGLFDSTSLASCSQLFVRYTRDLRCRDFAIVFVSY